MQTNNTIPNLFPAFNRSLLEVESFNFLKEKHSYLVDILADETTHNLVIDAVVFGYPGFALFFGGVGTTQYTPGDYVLVRTVTATTAYDGVYRVLNVPNDSVVILDAPITNVVTGADIKIYRIFRNKLPANPEGRAIFNLNGYATGRVTQDFGLNNVGAFNIPNSFDRFLFLPGEEYYENFTYQSIVADGVKAKVTGISGPVFVGQTVELRGNSNFTYDGQYQVTAWDGIDATINTSFVGTVVSTGVVITLPKVPIVYEDFADLSSDKLIFNGALSFPGILDFDGTNYDVSTAPNAPFLTTVPNNQTIKRDQRAYTQFYQSTNTTVTQFAVDVVDENGVTQQYIVNFSAAPENIIGLAVGTLDLNAIDPSLFETLPGRGLPVIQDCDRSYCVYLYGEIECNIQGTQTANFTHPYAQVLSPLLWSNQEAIWYRIETLVFEIGGAPQVFTPTGTTYNQATVTGQIQEEIYAQELALQTGLTVQSSLALGSGLTNGHWIDIDFSQDFLLVVEVKLQSTFFGKGVELQIEYSWNTATCTTSYKVLNGATKYEGKNGTQIQAQNIPGFIGLTSTLVTPIALSEKLCFELDYNNLAYSGARVLFQDRLGSFIGYNFNLKRSRRIETSSDGFERDDFAITGIDSATRGFETIQSSYSEEWDLLTNFISEEDAAYLEQLYTSPNIWVEFKGQVLPAVIQPQTQTAQEKENTDLRQVGVTLRVNRTQYSQRN